MFVLPYVCDGPRRQDDGTGCLQRCRKFVAAPNNDGAAWCPWCSSQARRAKRLDLAQADYEAKRLFGDDAYADIWLAKGGVRRVYHKVVLRRESGKPPLVLGGPSLTFEGALGMAMEFCKTSPNR